MAVKADKTEVQIVRISQASVSIAIVGESPLILNKLSEKVKHELLLPSQRKNAAAKASTLKHNPLAEFQASAHRLPDDSAPTLLAVPATAIKGAMRTAALDLPGASKAQIGRLVYLPDEYVPIYGIPFLKCDVVRSADMNKTPDVRTRAIVPKWVAIVTVQYTSPILREPSIINLIAAAGVTAGIGDWRVEKGSGSFGRFSLRGPDDLELKHILATGGRQAQIEAMAAAEPYDEETRELLSWFEVEAGRRGFRTAA